MATQHGALALGRPAMGQLAPGQPAHFTVVALADAELDDPYAALFDPRNRVRGTAIHGRTRPRSLC
jgi:cytosine/adenosine deaminase-related metal-dependent hydrolase